MKLRALPWVLSAVLLPAQTPPAAHCLSLRKHGQRAEANACFQELTARRDPYLRAEGAWGLERFQEANNEFRAAVKQEPRNALYRVRWGRLFLERFQAADAAKLFDEALELQPTSAQALLGLALVASDGFDRKAVEMAEKALAQDPKLVEAYELLAVLALEDSDEAKAVAFADKALSVAPDALDAMSVRAAVEVLNDRPAEPWVDRVRRFNPLHAGAWAIPARFLILNRRYEEGIALYRKALELDARHWPSRAELGVNLMRLGEETEARHHLETCYHNGFRAPAVVNSLRLMDSYRNFITYRSPGMIVRLHKKEAEVLRPYFEGELKRAIDTFEKKYQFKLAAPVQVEVYPDHEDFAVRTMGLPGLGALGVTFGYVVAMDSPSGRRPGTFHWASTLWHELSHVFVLAATRHRVPRWFTEGLAVHEETATEPDWGDRLSAEVISAVKNKRLLPVAQLDRGFIRPSYPSQVIVSYFQAGRICDYIQQRWGYQKLLDMMHSYARSRPTPEVIERHLGLKPEEFDKQFLAWLDKQVQTPVEKFDEWRKRLRALVDLARQKKFDEVIQAGVEIRDWYADYVEPGNAYELLAEAYLARNDKAAAIAQLERYAAVGGRNPAVLKKLAGLLEEAGRKKDAAVALNRINFVYPVNDEDLHRRLGELWLEQGNVEGAIREFSVAVASQPVDKAAAHFNLARALVAGRRTSEARDHLLQALEAAPSFKPAQKLLLEVMKD